MSYIIWQIGVGFYSAFVMADKVRVCTKSCDATKGTKFVLHFADDATEVAKVSMSKEAAQKFSFCTDFPISVFGNGEPLPIVNQEALWMKSSASAEEHTAFVGYISGSSYGEPFQRSCVLLSMKSCPYLHDPVGAPCRLFTGEGQDHHGAHCQDCQRSLKLHGHSGPVCSEGYSTTGVEPVWRPCESRHVVRRRHFQCPVDSYQTSNDCAASWPQVD